MDRIKVALAILVLATIVLGTTSDAQQAPSVPADPFDVQLHSLNDDERSRLIEIGIHTRTSLGFHASRSYVQSLHDDPERTTRSLQYGLLLTPTEEKELEARIALEEDGDAIRQSFEGIEEFFGGMYLDHQRGGLLVVQVTDLSAFVRDRALAVARYRERIVFEQVSTSYEHLHSIWRELSDRLMTRPDFAAEIHEVYIDQRSHEVIVGTHLEADDERLGAHLEPFTNDVVVRLGTGGSTTASMANDPNAPPIRGGHSFGTSTSSSSSGFCTLGFEVDKSGANDSAWMLTAGHCVDQLSWNAT